MHNPNLQNTPVTVNGSEETTVASTNARKLSYHEGLLRCSSILLSPERSENALLDTLQILLAVGNIDSAFIFSNFWDDKEGLCMSRVHVVQIAKTSATGDLETCRKDIPYQKGFAKLRSILSQGTHAIFQPGASEAKIPAFFEKQNSGTYLIMPIFVRKRWWGFIGFNYESPESQGWSKRHVSLIKTAAELIGAFIGNSEDVSRIKQANVILEEANANINTIINSLNAGVFVVDDRQESLFFNQKYLEMWGIPEAIAQDTQKRIAFVLDRIENADEFAKQIEGERTVHEAMNVTHLHLKDGRYFERSSGPYRMNGELIGQVVSYRDISERKRTEQLLVEAKNDADRANRAKSEFLAMMSHELRTPMNAIIGFTELLFENAFDNEDREYLNFISRNGEHLLQLIDQILDLAKIEAGSIKLQSEPVYPWKLACNVMRSLHPRTVGKAVKLIYSLSDDVPQCILSDEIRLNQILFNLAGNAIKFTESGSVELCVDVVCEADHHFLRCEILDSGIGIPYGKLTSVFEPFSQGDNSTTRKYGGTGLGLTISQKLVQQMGGRIWATNRTTGGSSFGFQIPLRAYPEGDPQNRDLTFPLQGRRILAIESNATQRKFYTVLFSRWQSDYVICDSVEKAGECLSIFAPETILLPLDELTAKDASFLQALQVYKDNGQLVLLGLSSSGYDLNAAGIPHPKLDRILRIPFDMDELKNAVVDLLDTASPIPIMQPTPVFPKSEEPHNRRRVLVIEDNEDNQKLTRSFLQKLGHEVAVAESGQAALETLNKEDFDILLMDVQMSGIDGLETTRRIRSGMAGIRHKDVPIIALTASAMRGDRERCLAAGMNDYLSKPVRLSDLEHTIDQYWKPEV